MDSPALHPDQYFHVRVVLGIIMGLSVARLLTGLARFVQHPNRQEVYAIHLGWVAFLLFAVMHFWWFEFGLARIDQWTFQIYFFLICYAALYFFICALLFPDRIDEYAGFADYFHSRQKWFYGLLAAMFALDVVDTLIKGTDYFQSLGMDYPIRQGLLVVSALIAMFVRDWRYHAVFVSLALITQIVWILSRFELL